MCVSERNRIRSRRSVEAGDWVLLLLILRYDMKKLAVLLITICSLLSGCIVYDSPYRDGGGYRGDHDGAPNRGNHDRDHDGVPDRQDRSPNNPNRY